MTWSRNSAVERWLRPTPMTRTDWPSRATSRPSDGRILRCARSPDAPKMTRSTGLAISEILRRVRNHLGGRGFVVHGTAERPCDRKGDEADHRLAEARR